MLLLALFTFPAVSGARPRPRLGPVARWELLGETSVSDRVDHDVLAVTARRGAFRGIRLRVLDRAVQFHDLKVHFGDGAVQDVAIRQVIPAGGESRVIDLPGRDRVIRSIELRYDAQSLAGHRARVRVWGLH